jgi:hypothetical protein
MDHGCENTDARRAVLARPALACSIGCCRLANGARLRSSECAADNGREKAGACRWTSACCDAKSVDRHFAKSPISIHNMALGSLDRMLLVVGLFLKLVVS